MKNTTLLILLLFATNVLCSQDDNTGYSNENLKIKSDYLQDSITLNLHLPETFSFSATATKYPITIIFDSQHKITYPQIINSIELLSNESQIPETIIVGVPFNRYNRYYRTAAQKKKNDSLSGIERMENFLFNELLPKLQKEYKVNEHITLIGHSRTAFLVNYLTTKHSKKINIAIALSGFYSNKPISIERFKNYISNDLNFPNKFSYYFTTGSALEEETYLIESKNVSDYISNTKMPKKFDGYFTENKHANHITNFWVSLPPIFIDAYSSYNSILNDWFYIKLKRETIKNPIKEFKSDLDQVSEKLGFKVNPNLTQIFSLASSFKYDKKDLRTAIDFIKFGQQYYPNYADFDLDLIDFYKQLNDLKMSQYHKTEYRKKVTSRKDISDVEKAELLKNID
jgi:enterochelin esterase-like enzyme